MKSYAEFNWIYKLCPISCTQPATARIDYRSNIRYDVGGLPTTHRCPLFIIIQNYHIITLSWFNLRFTSQILIGSLRTDDQTPHH